MKFSGSRAFFVLLILLSFSNSVFSQVPVADFTVDHQSGCSPLLVKFTSTSSGNPSSFTWDFGDGFPPVTLLVDTASHNYATPGVYTVTLTATNGSGPGQVIKTNFITVFRNPVANYTIDHDTVCSGTGINFTDASTPGDGVINQWNWTFNDGSPPVTGVSTVNHSFTNVSQPIRIFIPVLIVNDVNNCSSTFGDDSVFILESPTASLGIGSVSSCVVPTTVTFTNGSTGPTLYNWNFGDPSSGVNNFSTLATPSHIYNAEGSYLVTLVNGVTGCSAQDTMTVNIISPVAAFTRDSINCYGDSALFINNSTPSSATYHWTFGDLASGANNSSTLLNPQHLFTTPGQYVVKLVTHLGNCADSVSKIVVVRPRPPVNFIDSGHTGCSVPYTVLFFDTTSHPPLSSWHWDFGDPSSGSNSSTLQNPSHTYNNFGQYTISLTVTDTSGCHNTVIFNQYVKIIQPTIDFTQKDSGCVGDIFPFHAIVVSPEDPTITSYVWNFGDGTLPETDSTPNTTHQYNATGLFDVTLTITTRTGCTATLTKPGFIHIGTKPMAVIDSVLNTICFKDTVQFHDLSPAPVDAWWWFFGDGGSSHDQNPNWQYQLDTSGTVNPFSIYLIVYNNGCADSDTVFNMITVLSPLPMFGTAYNCITPDSVQFVNLSGGSDEYWWDFGDSTTISNDTNPSHVYSGPGVYDVILTDSNFTNHCKVDTVLQVNITNVTAVASTDTTIACKPGTIIFSSALSQDVDSIYWTFGEGIPNVHDTAYSDTLHKYNKLGNYIATLHVIDVHGCPATDTQMVHIVGPTAGFTGSPLSSCAPDLVTFNDTSHTFGSLVKKWIWNFGAGGPLDTLNSGTANYNYINPGLYTVTLTVIDSFGCRDTHTTPNYINPTQPQAGISMPDTGCRNMQSPIIGLAGPAGSYANPVTYHWDFGDGQTLSDTASHITHDYVSNGAYTIRLIVVDNNGCRDTTTKDVYVYTTSAAFHYTSFDTCVIENGIKKAVVDANFHSDSNDYVTNWNWNLTVVNDPVYASPDYYHRYDVAPGSYDASLIVTNRWGCTDTATIPGAVVVPGPSGSFTFVPDSGCAPLTVDFTGHSSNSLVYAWDFGDGTVLNGTPDSVISHTYLTPNIYHPQFYLGFQLSTSFCYVPVPSIDSILVTSLLGVNIVEDSVHIPNGGERPVHVTVNNPIGNGPYTYNWTPANDVINGNGSGTFQAQHNDNDSVYYYVTVPYGQNGCYGTDSVLVISDPCEIKWDSIPNVFTPDGDFKNDTYFIKDLCDYDNFRIRIFNRWGRIIYESTDPQFHWDGTTTSGDEASEGVYYYVLTAKKKDWHGYIDLIRNKK